MKITSETLINDALRLRKAQDELKGTRETGKRTSETQTRITNTLGEINNNLLSHQKTIAQLQLENMGLDRIQQNVDQLKSMTPGIDRQQVKDEIQTILDATRYRQEPLIPQSIRDLFKLDLGNQDVLQQATDSLTQRREALGTRLQKEFDQINKIQVSFENILSQQIPASAEAGILIKEITTQMSLQDKIQSNVNPATVMGLLQE